MTEAETEASGGGMWICNLRREGASDVAEVSGVEMWASKERGTAIPGIADYMMSQGVPGGDRLAVYEGERKIAEGPIAQWANKRWVRWLTPDAA